MYLKRDEEAISASNLKSCQPGGTLFEQFEKPEKLSDKKKKLQKPDDE